MSWVAVGVAVVGAVAKHQSDKKGRKAAKQGQDAAIASQEYMYDTTRGDLKPYMDFGAEAIPALQRIMAGDYSGFQNAPDYKWSTQQGIGQLDASAAARGNLFGGGHQKDLVQFNQGNANQFLQQYMNRLTNQAAAGQNAAAGLGGIGQNTANAISSAHMNGGLTQAQMYANQGDNYMGLAAAVGNGANRWYGQNQANNPGGTGWYFGNNPGKG